MASRSRPGSGRQAEAVLTAVTVAEAGLTDEAGTRDGGRPLRADARRNRERLMQAAEAAFAAEGLGVQVDEIARRARVGVGTFYRHFPTKEALFEAIVLDRLGQLVEEARSLADAEDPTGALFGFLERLVEQGSAKRDLADALSGSGFEERIATSGLVQELERWVGMLLLRAQATGTVRADVTVADLVGLVSGTCMAAERPGLTTCSTTRMLAIVCDGLRTPAHEPVPPRG